MKNSGKLFMVLSMLFLMNQLRAQNPPYSGTIFIDPDIIVPADPSAIQSTTYTGQGMRMVYDRRVNKFITVNAYLFKVVWKDGLTSEAIINAEFENQAAAKSEAEKYGFLIGQLPYCLRVDVSQIWVHKGTEPFGGGNKSILIHTGQTAIYEASGILEETLVHEACHTSLDLAHAGAAGWISAQNKDANFISTYARDNPTREDIAESFLPWLMVRYRASKISTADFNKITLTIPNRLAYFDSKAFNLFPFSGNIVSTADFTDPNQNLTVFPNPSTDFVGVKDIVEPTKFKIYDANGTSLIQGEYTYDKWIDIQFLPKSIYFIKFENKNPVKFIKL